MSAGLLLSTNEQTNDSSDVFPVGDILDVCQNPACVICVCLCVCAALAALSVAFLHGRVCTAGSLGSYVRSDVHIRQKHKTQPISLCHSDFIGAPGAFWANQRQRYSDADETGL